MLWANVAEDVPPTRTTMASAMTLTNALDCPTSPSSTPSSDLDCYGGLPMSIEGVNFCEATEVLFGTEPAEIISVSSIEIELVYPFGDGTVDVVVVTPTGTSLPYSVTYGDPGCFDPNACNYTPDATCAGLECLYADEVGDCGGDCTSDVDSDGICDDVDDCIGFPDECGICNGLGAIYECGCGPIPAGDCDCDGNQLDALGNCGGGCTADNDSDGICDDSADNCTDLSACNFNDPNNAACAYLGRMRGVRWSGHSRRRLRLQWQPVRCLRCLWRQRYSRWRLRLRRQSARRPRCVWVVHAHRMRTATGICDDEDDCFGTVDACGVCNGPGAIYGCGCFDVPQGDCDCFGNQMDANGICGGDCIATTNCPDLDQDGTVGVGDILIVLGEYGASCNESIFGCTLPDYLEFDPEANVNDGSCLTPVIPGCTDPAYIEYNAAATVDDGSCATSTCVSVEMDGHTYDVVEIGDQCWFAENLRTTVYSNGNLILNGLDGGDWLAITVGATAVYGDAIIDGCQSYSPDIDACDEAQSLAAYGRLYNWHAVDDARGLCPAGWHVPTDWEWRETGRLHHISGICRDGRDGIEIDNRLGQQWQRHGRLWVFGPSGRPPRLRPHRWQLRPSRRGRLLVEFVPGWRRSLGPVVEVLHYRRLPEHQQSRIRILPCVVSWIPRFQRFRVALIRPTSSMTERPLPTMAAAPRSWSRGVQTRRM